MDIHNKNLGITDLMRESYNGDSSKVKNLIEKRANVNAKDKNGDTALIYALYALIRSHDDNVDAVKSLIANDADVNAEGSVGRPLEIAIIAERESDTKPATNALLHAENIDVDTKDSTYGNTPLMIALLHNTEKGENTKTIQELIKKGADINWANRNYKTALMYASERNDVPSTKLLLENGAREHVNAQDNTGKTALMHAMQDEVDKHFAGYSEDPLAQHYDLVKLLLENGADINIRDRDGNKVKHYIQGSKAISEKFTPLFKKYKKPTLLSRVFGSSKGGKKSKKSRKYKRKTHRNKKRTYKK
jgi:ankyrin repeat protein